jgi:protein arginine N-methyltransferase 1
MRSSLEALIRSCFRRAKALIRASPTARKLLYDDANIVRFTGLSVHEGMLADTTRVGAYREAIARVVRPGHVVADLGTGTGVLAIFAARAGAGKVYAIDHSDFIAVAERIADGNGVSGITFAHANSRDFTPAEPLDAIIHEQMGPVLLDENMLENVLDLKRRALKPGGRILPARFELFFEPVSLDPARVVPRLTESRLYDIDFTVIQSDPVLAPFRRPEDDLGFLVGAFGGFLCRPEPMMRLDLEQMSDASEMPRVLEARRSVARSGPLDAVSVHFRALFAEDIAIDTSPAGPPTHWPNLYFRVPQRHCREGETLLWRVEISDPLDVRTWKVAID